MEQELEKTLSGYYRVLPPAEVEWALVRLGLMRGQSPDPNQAIRLGQMLGVDALVMGEVILCCIASLIFQNLCGEVLQDLSPCAGTTCRGCRASPGQSLRHS